MDWENVVIFLIVLFLWWNNTKVTVNGWVKDYRQFFFHREWVR